MATSSSSEPVDSIASVRYIASFPIQAGWLHRGILEHNLPFPPSTTLNTALKTESPLTTRLDLLVHNREMFKCLKQQRDSYYQWSVSWLCFCSCRVGKIPRSLKHRDLWLTI